VRRLADDHANAEFLAAGLHAIGLSVVAPQTNILYVDIPVPKIPGLKAHLDGRGINVTVTPRTRLVTHLDVPHPKIATTLQAFREFDWAD